MGSYSIKLAGGHYSGADSILLTTDRAESIYGRPVAVLIGGPNDGVALGPDDLVPVADEADHLSWLRDHARLAVAAAAPYGVDLVHDFIAR